MRFGRGINCHQVGVSEAEMRGRGSTINCFYICYTEVAFQNKSCALQAMGRAFCAKLPKRFQTNALMVPPVGGNNFGNFAPNCLVGLARCSHKAEFSFLQRKTAFWCSFKRVSNWDTTMESSGGVVVRVLASQQCGPGSILKLSVICGLSLLVLCSERFFSGYFSPQKPTFDKIWFVLISICSVLN